MLFRFPALLYVALLLIMVSCTVSSEITPSTMQLTNSTKGIKLHESGLAILPFLRGGEFVEEWQMYGNALNRQSANKAAILLTWQETQQRLMDDNLWSDYVTLMNGFDRNGTLDNDILARISKSLGVNYVLFAEAGTPITKRKKNYDILTGAVNNLKAHELVLHATLWNTKGGEVMWKGFADSEMLTSLYRYSGENPQQTADKLAQAIMDQITMY